MPSKEPVNSIENGYVTSSSNHRLDQLSRDVSQHVGIRKDVVDLVLRGFFDIMIERLMHEGKFKVYGLFSIKNHEWSGYTAGHGDSTAEVKSRRRLKVRLGAPLLDLWKIREDKGDEFARAINRDNWREVLERFSLGRKNSKKSGRTDSAVPAPVRKDPPKPVNRFPDGPDLDSDFNPFLDYDEDE